MIKAKHTGPKQKRFRLFKWRWDYGHMVYGLDFGGEVVDIWWEWDNG